MHEEEISENESTDVKDSAMNHMLFIAAEPNMVAPYATACILVMCGCGLGNDGLKSSGTTLFLSNANRFGAIFSPAIQDFGGKQQGQHGFDSHSNIAGAAGWAAGWRLPHLRCSIK